MNDTATAVDATAAQQQLAAERDRNELLAAQLAEARRELSNTQLHYELSEERCREMEVKLCDARNLCKIWNVGQLRSIADHAVLEREEALAMVDASDAVMGRLEEELVSLRALSLSKAELAQQQETDITALQGMYDALAEELRLCQGQLLLQERASEAARSVAR